MGLTLSVSEAEQQQQNDVEPESPSSALSSSDSPAPAYDTMTPAKQDVTTTEVIAGVAAQQQDKNSTINSDTPETKDEENPASDSNEYPFVDSCKILVSIGVAAFSYGGIGGNVERFLQDGMTKLGYVGVFRLTQSELFVCARESADGMPVTWIVPVQDGVDLHRLGLLVEVAKDIMNKRISLDQALEELEVIRKKPNPVGPIFSLLALAGIGAGLVVLLNGTWNDVILGGILGGLNYVILQLFGRFPEWIQRWTMLVSAFVPAVIVSICNALWDANVNPTLVTLSAVALQLPGYIISIGLAELGTNRFVAGGAHLIAGLVTLLWLALGALLGIAFVDAVADFPPVQSDTETVRIMWQILFFPMVAISLSAALQNSYRDFPWAVLCQAIAYALTYLPSVWDSIRPNLATFLAAVVYTICANLWGWLMNRPNTLVLVPAFILSVSGSIGFRGLINVGQGDSFLGQDQFIQMFLVGLLNVAGVLAGSTLVKPYSTL